MVQNNDICTVTVKMECKLINTVQKNPITPQYQRAPPSQPLKTSPYNPALPSGPSHLPQTKKITIKR